jgi:hypothetical protein
MSTSWEQAKRTHPDDKLLKQYCYKSAAGLLQVVALCVFMCVVAGLYVSYIENSNKF